MTTALITGVTGQDGTYLAEQLVADSIRVVGLSEPGGAIPSWLPAAVDLVEGNLRDGDVLEALVAKARPDLVFNLAAQSSVGDSYERVIETCEVTGLGALRLLDICHRTVPTARFVQASSAEMFGDALVSPQTETTPFQPRSPYGIAKLMAHQMVVSYRSNQRMFCCNAILFNHESPRRGAGFVTRKITKAAARIGEGLQSSVSLGNLDARRDWGFAGDYVRALRLMALADEPDDYVVATGVTHSIRDLLEIAFARVGLNWKAHVTDASSLHRPHDISELRGDASLLRRRLGWSTTIGFEDLIHLMVDADLAEARQEAAQMRRSD